ncbi:hypothetical protein BRARA_K00775 [Brassica rapa]|uniref:Replication factor A C-terminal domain-containing protein n=1 Tax=Brassica campestris TaxID=3711 RepID=A0A397L7Y2_BRACM|nr:hypothetical protein BRARA_K00775 [Brassica rapa]
MYRVQRDIQLGEWRELENFKISAAGGQYRPSKFQYKLTVIGDTKIKPTDYRDENQFLSLASYEEIVTGKLKTFFLIGEVQITNAFDSSVLMLNPIMEEAIDFRQKMSQTDLPLALLGSSDENKVIKQVVDDWNEVDIKCISEIYLAVEAESCKIVCTIEAIDTDWGWFYFGCNRHNRRTTRVGRKGGGKMVESEKPVFYCDVCRANTTDVSPKYKLHLFVKDDTGSCQLMLLDTVAKTIIGEKADTLWDGSYAEVSEVWSGDHIHRIESLSEPVSLIETNSSTLSTGEVRLIDYNIESSSDVSTPFSKRKEGDAELSDMNSTSKKLRAQSIKVEKIKED